ncbi:MAG: Cna B-type domain-containing protein [Lachnospiraceae bacterium]|nr:Cna B-type domain-containing protein [Lachnospiraceae bacterium]
MRDIVDSYVEKFKEERRRKIRVHGFLLALALVVIAGIAWQLHSTGVALTYDVYCGLEEHQHDESCYEQVLVCGLEETEGVTETEENHTHAEECYEQALVCDLEEHTHTEACMSGESDAETADGETADGTTEEIADAAEGEADAEGDTAEENLDPDGSIQPDATEEAVLEGTEEETVPTYTYEDDTLTVTVVLPEDSEVPEDAVLVVTALTEADDSYETLEQQAQETLSSAIQNILFYDISFYTTNDEYIPVDETAQVSLVFQDSALTENTFVMHFTEDANTGVELVNANLALNEDGTVSSITFEIDGFSVVGFAAPASNGESSDIYVSTATVTLESSGTGPFDGDDEDGNDSSESNDIIRSFDLAIYSLTVDMDSYTKESYTSAIIWVEITLQGTSMENTFDEDTLTWMDSYSVTYAADGKSKTLLGYYTATADEYAIPGTVNDLPIGIQVLAMDDGTILQAEGNVWLEDEWGNYSDEVPISLPKLEISAKLQLNVELVETTEATSSIEGTFNFNTSDESYLNYGLGNVYGNMYGYGIILQLYNTESGKGMKGQALPDGNDITLTVTLSSAYQVDTSGVDTEYAGKTLDLSTEFGGKYQVLFYGLEGNTRNDTQTDGRNLVTVEGETLTDTCSRDVPLNAPGSLGVNAVENGGTWTAVSQEVEQGGTTIKIKVSGYQITQLLFPYKASYVSDITYYAQGTDVEDIDIACFSVGELWVFQPYEYTDADGKLHELLYEAGAGTFTISVADGVVDGNAGQYVSGSYDSYSVTRDANGSITAASETAETVQVKTQEKDNDDKKTKNKYIRPSGSFSNRINYTDGTYVSNSVQGINDDYYTATNYAILGEEALGVVGGFHYTAKTKYNRMAAANVLVKFDADALEMDAVNTFQNSYYTGLSESNATVFYGYLSSGENWESDDEMQAADEDDLIWYSERQSNKKCVAVLFEYRMPASSISLVWCLPHIQMHVLTDSSLADNVYMICQVTRMWTATDIVDAYNALTTTTDPITVDDITADAAGKSIVEQIIPSAVDNYYTCLDSDNTLSVNHATSTLLDESFGWGNGGDYSTAAPGDHYTKTAYNADGSGSYTGHNGGWYYGASLLILSYQSSISKSIAQKVTTADVSSGGTVTSTKSSYSLHNSERIADYVLTGTFKMTNSIQTSSSQTTTVTIVDTLPADMTYRIDSAYYGLASSNGSFAITYEQNSTAGQQGTVTGGNEFIQVSTSADLTDTGKTAVLYEELNSDGTTTLTFVVRNVPVQSGEVIRIYYSVELGDETDDSKDLQNGAQLTNTATIRTTEDCSRAFSTTTRNMTTNTISISKIGSTAFSKYAVKQMNEVNEDLSWRIIRNNNGSYEATLKLVDAMPYNGDDRGTTYSGSYTISSWSIDTSKISYSAFSGDDPIILYYTTDSAYAGCVLTLSNTAGEGEVTWDTVKSNWNVLTITLTGTAESYTATANFSNVNDFVYAWAVGGTLPAGESIDITLTVHQDSASGTDELVNTASASSGTDVFQRSAAVYRVVRSVSGTVWLDEDLDGGIDENEQVISGARVTLQVQDDSGDWVDAKDLFGKSCVATTDTSGLYSFTNLAAGTYRILFTDGSSMNYTLSEHSLTEKEAAGIAASLNSKAIQDTENDSQGVISDIALPAAEDMTVRAYALGYQNAGYTKTVEFAIEKVWKNTDGNNITSSKTNGSVTVQLYDGNGNAVRNELTLSNANSWKETITDLPYYDGTGQAVDYTVYSVLEDVVDGYNTTYSEVDQIDDNNYAVTVINTAGVELPLTGGTGTYPYAMAGMLLTGGAAYLLYRLRRRKELMY